MRVKVRQRTYADGRVVWTCDVHVVPAGEKASERFRLVAPPQVTSKTGAERWAMEHARQIAADHGAEVIGTAEAVDIDPDERDAAILARHERRAENAETEADARYAAVRSTMDMISMGQPILVGHHSEGRHRRDLARMDANMRRAIEADQRAKDEQRLADGAARRIAHRATLAAAVPVPVEMIQPGDEVLRMTAARRRTYTVHKVNRTTIAWAWQGCSGSFKHAEAVELHRDGVQLWPVLLRPFRPGRCVL